jgi:branched-subunit amino acid transport protein
MYSYVYFKILQALQFPDLLFRNMMIQKSITAPALRCITKEEEVMASNVTAGKMGTKTQAKGE